MVRREEQEGGRGECGAALVSIGSPHDEHNLPTAITQFGQTKEAMFPSLCHQCHHVRTIVSGKGSQFLLCERALVDARYPKYPPQPLLRCEGFTLAETVAPTDKLGTPPNGR